MLMNLYTGLFLSFRNILRCINYLIIDYMKSLRRLPSINDTKYFSR